MRVEICVTDAASALAAERGGADRVELCRDLAVGGLTPTEDLFRAACHALKIPVHVLIRPRAGDFRYTEDEFDAMLSDIHTAKTLGAQGVVVGVLTGDGTVDRARTGRLVAAARPLSVTFHKAFDETRDPFGSLEHLVNLGVDRILTSGQAPTALAGLERLASLTEHARGRIIIMAGGRIRAGDVPALERAGLCEIHLASGVRAERRSDAGGDAIVDSAKVAEIVRLARSRTASRSGKGARDPETPIL